MLANDGELCWYATPLTFQQNRYSQSDPAFLTPLLSREQGNRRKVIFGTFYNLGGIPIPSVLVFPARQRLPLCADTDFPSPLSLSAPSQQYYLPCWSLSFLATEKLVLPLAEGVSLFRSDDKKARTDTKSNRVVALPRYVDLGQAARTDLLVEMIGKKWCSVNLLVAISLD